MICAGYYGNYSASSGAGWQASWPSWPPSAGYPPESPGKPWYQAAVQCRSLGICSKQMSISSSLRVLTTTHHNSVTALLAAAFQPETGGGEAGGCVVAGGEDAERQYGSRAGAAQPRLGINSNIYSLYSRGRAGAGEAGDSSSAAPPGYTEAEQFSQHCMQDGPEQADSTREEDQRSPAMEPDSSTDLAAPAVATERPVKGRQDRKEGGSDCEAEERSLDGAGSLLQHRTARKMLAGRPNQDQPKRIKATKSPQEELAELMKLTNEKLFNNSNRVAASNLPLSVEIEELDSSSDSVSPPRNLPASAANPFMITNSLSPRKRGRKPKHYSEILFELGQRGISITKTSKQQQQQQQQPSAHQHEMVVSDNGAVSHKASGQQLKCPHCNKILTTSVGLMYHIRLHTGQLSQHLRLGSTLLMVCCRRETVFL